MADTQVVDSSGMPRPASLSSGLSDACSAPFITTDPIGGTINASTPSVTLSVSATGTAPFTYEWRSHSGTVGTGPTLTATSSNTPATAGYWVVVTNACKSVESAVALVSVGECIAPGGEASFTRNANGTYTLAASGTGTEPRTYTWRRATDQSVVGNARTVTVGPLSANTTYTVTIDNNCPDPAATRSVTVTLPDTTVMALTAVRTQNANQVQVNWSGTSAGVVYRLQRRNGAAGWADLPPLTAAELTANTYYDNVVGPNQTYAYRLRTPADPQYGSRFSNADVATTRTFATVSDGGLITASSFEVILAAVNSVRASAGWPAVSWSNILSSRDPLPVPGAVVMSAHISSVRARMNEALQALGVGVLPYTDGVLPGASIKDTHVNEIIGRAY